MAEFLIPLIVLVLVVAALADIITRPDASIKHLPKVLWVIVVLLFPLIGAILWFVVGREYQIAGGNGGGRYSESIHRGEPTVIRQQVSSTRVSITEQELRDLDREIEYHEKQAQLRRLQADGGDSVVRE